MTWPGTGGGQPGPAGRQGPARGAGHGRPHSGHPPHRPWSPTHWGPPAWQPQQQPGHGPGAGHPDPHGRRPWVRAEGWDWRRKIQPRMPDAMAAEVERRGVRREARAATRFARRARWTAGGWAALAAVITPAGAALGGGEWWLWLLTGAGSLANSGLWALQAARADRRNPGPPLPAAAAPGVRALTGSAAAEPLRRGEEAISALLALARPVPAGPTADVIRSAMASAAEVVDGLRLRANRVVACEAAARALADPSARAQLAGTTRALVVEMNTAVRALDELVAAAADVVGAGVYASSGGIDLGGPPLAGVPAGGAGLGMTPVDLDGLADQAENLRGYAAGLRDVGAAARGLPTGGAPAATPESAG